MKNMMNKQEQSMYSSYAWSVKGGLKVGMMLLAMMLSVTVAGRTVAHGSTKSTMSFTHARQEALFLSDKMAYELDLTSAQYDAVYEINLDYMLCVSSGDVYGTWWNRRNKDLQYVLTVYQYNKYMGKSYFYRPLGWDGKAWSFSIYGHYTNKNRFYKNHPSGYASYKGGNNKQPGNHYADRQPVNRQGTALTYGEKRHTDNKSKVETNTGRGRNGGNNHQLAQNNRTSPFGGR